MCNLPTDSTIMDYLEPIHRMGLHFPNRFLVSPPGSVYSYVFFDMKPGMNCKKILRKQVSGHRTPHKVILVSVSALMHVIIYVLDGAEEIWDHADGRPFWRKEVHLISGVLVAYASRYAGQLLILLWVIISIHISARVHLSAR